MANQCLVLNEPTHFHFKLQDFLSTNGKDQHLTYESGYSSNDETSLNSPPRAERTTTQPAEENPYRVTITDAYGNMKPNLTIRDANGDLRDNVRVDFTPDEKILFINISCTW